MTLPARPITIREVGTRDGIQSLGAFIDTAHKVELVEALSETGLRRIEATSFVNPRAVPQMADAGELMSRVRRRADVSYEALVPNVRGAQDALAARVDALLVVVTASEAFNQKNVRMSVDASLSQFASVKQLADACHVTCVGAIGTAFGCPYEGDIPESRLFSLIERFLAMGFSELMLADTTGMANPSQIERTIGRVLGRWGDRARFGLHLHNTRGMGLANVVRRQRRWNRRVSVRASGRRQHFDRGHSAHAARDGVRHRHRPRPADRGGAPGAADPGSGTARPGHEGRPTLAAARGVKASGGHNRGSIRRT